MGEAKCISVIERHIRQVELSPGIGEDKQRYALAMLQEIIDDIKAAHSTPPPNTVPVRIAVAVSSDPDDFPFIETTSLGEWGCDEDAFEHLREELAKPCRISVITAHVPLPEQPAEVEGSVEHE